MLDLYSYNNRTCPHSMNVSITEKRAPTDESLRLLKEMQEKTFKEVNNSIVLDNNVFKGIIYFHNDMLTFTKNLKVVFDWNGKRIIHDSKIPVFIKDDVEIVSLVVKELSETIAREILNNTIDNRVWEQLCAK